MVNRLEPARPEHPHFYLLYLSYPQPGESTVSGNTQAFTVSLLNWGPAISLGYADKVCATCHSEPNYYIE